MRNYLINELPEGATARVAKVLENRGLTSSLGDLFWIPLPEELLTACQREHMGECGPHAAGLECNEDFLQLELLVRACSKLRCDCVAYATVEQRAWLLNYVDTLLKELDIPA